MGAPGRILTICTPAGNMVGVPAILFWPPLVVVVMVLLMFGVCWWCSCPWLRVLVIVTRPAVVTVVDAAAVDAPRAGDIECSTEWLGWFACTGPDLKMN